MSESQKPNQPNPAISDSGEVVSNVQPPARSRLGAFWFALRMLEVRLRFVAVLVGIGLIIGYWDTLQNYWDRFTRPAVVVSANMGGDTEFYCPMDPSIIRAGLEPNGSIPKCPICGMPLSLRKKGGPTTLPSGVISRVSLTPDRIRMAGIRTSEIAIRPMTRSLRAVGAVAYNEGTRSQIVSRVGGYLEKLMVDKTFMEVRQGDPLAEIYSPELYAAIQELKVAQSISGSSLASIARDKIRLLGIDDKEVDKALALSDASYRVVVRSPSTGYVIKKNVQQGASITAGQMLFEIADLSTVWIEADVFERDIGLLQEGQEIIATVDAYPDREFKGTVSLIYPELQTATRTNRVRFEVDNEELLLRSGMYATVVLETLLQTTEPFHTMLVASKQTPADPAEAIARQSICPVTGAKLGSMGDPIPVLANGQTVFLCCAGCLEAIESKPDYYLARLQTVSDAGVLAVPETAVIDTGDKKIVYVQRGEGVFEGIEVKLGSKSDGFYSVVSGLLPGDQVAAAGAFLIDAETRLNPAASAAYFGAGGSMSSVTSTGENPSAGFQPNSLPDGSTMETTKPLSILPPEQNVVPADASPARLTDEALANIAQLSPDDQLLARSQVLCPITEKPLGSMGVPLKIMVNGEPVMLCCPGCKAKALRNAADTLAKVSRLKAQNKTPTPQ